MHETGKKLIKDNDYSGKEEVTEKDPKRAAESRNPERTPRSKGHNNNNGVKKKHRISFPPYSKGRQLESHISGSSKV